MPNRESNTGYLMAALGFALLAIVLIVLPHLLSFSQQEILVLLVINVLLVSSYRLLTLTGEWSLAHAVIMGVGAYSSALVSKNLGVPVPLAMIVGASTAGFLAFLLSFPLFRMKGFYFLIASFAAGEVIRLMWKWSDLTFLFGGPKGIKRIPSFPDILSIDFYEPVNYYYLCVIVVGISLLILYRVERSRVGLTFHAIHWQDKLAESVGVKYLPVPHAGLCHLRFLCRSRRRAIRPLCGRRGAEQIQRRGDGLHSYLGHRRRNSDILRSYLRRGGPDRPQRGRPALAGCR